jgi:hypothetical protein
VRIGKGAGMAAAPDMAAAGTAQPPLQSVTTSAGQYESAVMPSVPFFAAAVSTPSQGEPQITSW